MTDVELNLAVAKAAEIKGCHIIGTGCYCPRGNGSILFRPTTDWTDAMEAVGICYQNITDFDRRQKLIDVVQSAVRPSATVQEGWQGEEFHPEKSLRAICEAIVAVKGEE